MEMKRTVKIGIAALGILSMMAIGRRLQAQVETPAVNAPQPQPPVPTATPGSIPAPVLSPGYFNASNPPKKFAAKKSPVKRQAKAIAIPTVEVPADGSSPTASAKPTVAPGTVPPVVLSPGYYQVGGVKPVPAPTAVPTP